MGKHGYRVVQKQGANHGLHLVLTILTGGMWALTGWPIATMLGRKKVTKIPAGAAAFYNQMGR